MKHSRTTCRIFGRSQRHEWFNPNMVGLDYAAFLFNYAKKSNAIEPHQTVTRRYILANQYWEKAE